MCGVALAVKAHSSVEKDRRRAQQLGRASITMSVVGALLSLLIVIIVLAV